MIIGLTGGIGSGKTEVSRRFEKLGIQVVDADIIARQVVEPKSHALNQITKHFGLHILTEDLQLNRSKLREIIFANPLEKIWLENLLHPIIRAETIKQLNGTTSIYCILVSPLLLEKDQHTLVNRILVIDTDPALQISRASARDSSSPEQIERIIATQHSREKRLAQADDVITNTGDLNNLDQQVNALHHFYLTLISQ